MKVENITRTEEDHNMQQILGHFEVDCSTATGHLYRQKQTVAYTLLQWDGEESISSVNSSIPFGLLRFQSVLELSRSGTAALAAGVTSFRPL